MYKIIKRNKKFMSLIVFSFCMILSTSNIWAGPIEESIQMVQDWMKAFKEGNAEALSNLFAKDGIYISWAGPFPAVGREAIRGVFEGFFRMYPIRLLFLRDESRQVYGDTVIYNCNWTFIYGDGKGPIKTVYGRTSSANAVVEGKRVLLLQDTSLLPVAGP